MALFKIGGKLVLKNIKLIVLVQFVLYLLVILQYEPSERVVQSLASMVEQNGFTMSRISRLTNTIIREKQQQPTITEYYKSHYGNCQFSVVKENHIVCSDKFQEGKNSSIIPIDKTRVCNLTKISENCELFREINGYNKENITDEEKEFPLAFGIRLHNAAEQAEQLLRIIYRPQNFYCFHVDKRKESLLTFQYLKSVSRCFDNVLVISKIRTIYSSVRLIYADLSCMKEALKSGISWKYFLNMAGTEMPIKTNLEIVRICKMLKGRNDIESQPMTNFTKIRYHSVYNITGYSYMPKYLRARNDTFKYGIELRKGNAYGILSRNFTEFVLKDEIAKSFLLYLKDTFAPEETYFPSLNYLNNAPGGYKVTVEHAKFDVISRLVLWRWDRKVCNGKYQRSVCVFNNMGLGWIVKRPEVIVNKVVNDYDQVIIDCLEEYLSNRTRYGSSLNSDIYKRYPHTADLYLH